MKILSAALILLAAFTLSATAQEKTFPRTISVSGEGSVSMKQNRYHISQIFGSAS